MADVAKLTMSLDDIIANAKPARPSKPAQKKQNKPKQVGGGNKAPITSGPRKGLNKNRNRNRGAAPMDTDMDMDYGAPAPRRQQQNRPQQQQQQQHSLRSAPPLGSAPQRKQKGGGGRAPLAVKPAVQKRQAPAPRNALEARGNRGGIVVGRSNGGGRGPAPIQAPRRQHPQERAAALEGDARWGHDMYEGGPRRQRAIAPEPSAASTSKLIVRNLHFDVSENDLVELFGSVGEVKAVKLNYDDSGRSLGHGFVEFKLRSDAEAARKQFDGVELDNQAMEIFFAGAAKGPGAGLVLSSGIRVGGRPGGASGARPRPQGVFGHALSDVARDVGGGRPAGRAGNGDAFSGRMGGPSGGRMGAPSGGRMGGRLRSTVVQDDDDMMH